MKISNSLQQELFGILNNTHDTIFDGSAHQHASKRLKVLTDYLDVKEGNPDISLSQWMTAKGISKDSYFYGTPKDLSLNGRSRVGDVKHAVSILKRSVYKRRLKMMEAKLAIVNTFIVQASPSQSFGEYLVKLGITPKKYSAGLPNDLQGRAIYSQDYNSILPFAKSLHKFYQQTTVNFINEMPSDVSSLGIFREKNSPIPDSELVGIKSKYFNAAARSSRSFGAPTGSARATSMSSNTPPAPVATRSYGPAPTPVGPSPQSQGGGPLTSGGGTIATNVTSTPRNNLAGGANNNIAVGMGSSGPSTNIPPKATIIPAAVPVVPIYPPPSPSPYGGGAGAGAGGGGGDDGSGDQGDDGGYPGDYGPQCNINPNTGNCIDPDTGYDINSVTGLLINPVTGYDIDPVTGLDINPATGQDFPPPPLPYAAPPMPASGPYAPPQVGAPAPAVGPYAPPANASPAVAPYAPAQPAVGDYNPEDVSSETYQFNYSAPNVYGADGKWHGFSIKGVSLKGLEEDISDVGKALKKVSLSGVLHDINKFDPVMVGLREAVKGVLDINLFGLATDFGKQQAGDTTTWHSILDKWSAVGGTDKNFGNAVNTGKGKKKFGADGGRFVYADADDNTDDDSDDDSDEETTETTETTTTSTTPDGSGSGKAPAVKISVPSSGGSSGTGSGEKAAIVGSTAALAGTISAAVPPAAPYAVATAGVISSMAAVLPNSAPSKTAAGGNNPTTQCAGLDEKTCDALKATDKDSDKNNPKSSSSKPMSQNTKTLLYVGGGLVLFTLIIMATRSRTIIVGK